MSLHDNTGAVVVHGWAVSSFATVDSRPCASTTLQFDCPESDVSGPGSKKFPANMINLRTLGPTELVVTMYSSQTYAPVYVVAVAHDENVSTTQIRDDILITQVAGTARMMASVRAAAGIAQLKFSPSSTSNYSYITPQNVLSCVSDVNSTLKTYKLGGVQYTGDDFSGCAIYKSAVNSTTAPTLVKSSSDTQLRFSVANKNFIVLGSELKAPVGNFEYRSNELLRVMLPTRLDMFQTGVDFGWDRLRITVVAFVISGTIGSGELYTAVLPKMYAPARISANSVIGVAKTSGDVHTVANLQPLTVSLAAGGAPVTVQPGLIPLNVNVLNPQTSVDVTGTVQIDRSVPMPVCGPPAPPIGSIYPRVPITTERITALGVAVDKPMTITNIAGMVEWPPLEAARAHAQDEAPLIVSGGSVNTLLPFSAHPLQTSSQAQGEPLPVVIQGTVEVSGAVSVAGTVKVAAAEEQARPLWTSEVDPDR